MYLTFPLFPILLLQFQPDLLLLLLDTLDAPVPPIGVFALLVDLLDEPLRLAPPNLANLLNNLLLLFLIGFVTTGLSSPFSSSVFKLRFDIRLWGVEGCLRYLDDADDAPALFNL